MLSWPHLAQLIDSKCNSVKCNVSEFLEKTFSRLIITFRVFSFDLVDIGAGSFCSVGAVLNSIRAPTHVVTTRNRSRHWLVSSEVQSSRWRSSVSEQLAVPSVKLGTWFLAGAEMASVRLPSFRRGCQDGGSHG